MNNNRYRRSRTLGGLATGIFIISLAVAFYFSEQFGWHLLVPILFAGGAAASPASTTRGDAPSPAIN